MPPTAFIPDGEPDVFEFNGEPRLFVYGSRDERITGFCGYGHDIWSAPVNDLRSWTNHGEAFHVDQVKAIGYGKVNQQHFGAPDAVYNPVTKKYYLYTFLGALYEMDGEQGPSLTSQDAIPGFEHYGPKCVMAQSDSPAGPFTDPVMCDWPPANIMGAFDPSVLVDEQADGSVKVYAFWGMRKGDRWAQLDPKDMVTIIDPKTGNPDRNAWQKTLNAEIETHSTLFEASSIKKIAQDKYVFIYSPHEEISALKYLYSNRPTGPWTYGGVIVRNNQNWYAGNNHGSIAKVGDQWYVVYHKSTNNHKNRQAMIEPIEIIIDGDKIIIPEVEMTSQGIYAQGLPLYKRYNAHIASHLSEGAYINAIPRRPDGLHPIAGLHAPIAEVGFKYFDFGQQVINDNHTLSLKLNVDLISETTISLWVVEPDKVNDKSARIRVASKTYKPTFEKVGNDITLPINLLNDNQALTEVGGLHGKLAVFITFEGEKYELLQLKELEFVKI